jgi:glycosyltransferase involved in cell wall biosynthesis
MTVSVVIATYNRSDLVREAIQAAQSQSQPPQQIVVLDDASTDATHETLARLAAIDPRLQIYRRASNSGGVAAWNEAIGHAWGDLIAFCADDDRLLPDHLEASAAYLDQHPATGLVHSSFIDARENDTEAGIIPSFDLRKLRSKTPLQTSHANLLSYMTRYYDWPFHPSTLVLRRGVWAQTGAFNPRYALADTDWFVRALEKFTAVMLPRHGVYSRRHAGNWSNRLGSAEMQREIFEIVEALIERSCRDRPLLRKGWKALWRADVRMHLLLTLLARLRSRHADAACAAWHGMLDDTGRRAPAWLEHTGERLLRAHCLRHAPHPSHTRHNVTPL